MTQLWQIMFVYFVYIFPSLFVVVNGGLLFNRCSGSQERCGLFGWNIVMHSDDNTGTGTDNDQCIDHCVFFYDNTLQCGSCSSRSTTGSDTADTAVPNPSPAVNIITPPPTASITSAFNIGLSLTNVPIIDQGLFTKAARRWESVIVGDIKDIPRNRLIYPLDKECAVPVMIDDVYICAHYTNIDGPIKLIATSQICELRDVAPYFPITAHIAIDSSDISYLKNNSWLEPLILQAMGHDIGFAEIWERSGVATRDPISGNCTYRGRKAQAEYAAISGCGTVPVDPGSCFLWSEECMGSEIMAGTVGAGSQPLSRITIASMEDIGYTVNYTSADPYTRANLNPKCQCRRRTLLDMFHGEVHQLGLRHHGVQRRKLSDEMYDMAVSYGKAKIAKQSKRKFGSFLFDHKIGTTTQSESTTSVGTISGSVIAVFVIENDTIFEVIVRSDD